MRSAAVRWRPSSGGQHVDPGFHLAAGAGTSGAVVEHGESDPGVVEQVLDGCHVSTVPWGCDRNAPTGPRSVCGMEPLEVVLPSGATLRVRPIGRDDKPLLKAGLARLSERSRFFRFHTIVTDLTDEQLRYLTELDYRDHFAWGATVLVDGEEEPVGVARYVRDKDRPAAAEAAVTVVDGWQGQGVGSFLLEALAGTAMANGIATFTAFVLSENEEMLDLFQRLGASLERRGEETLLEVPLPLTETRYRDSRLHRMLRAMAEGSAAAADPHRDERGD